MNETIRTRTGEIRVTPADEARMDKINATLNQGEPLPDSFDRLLTFVSKVLLAGCCVLGAAVVFFVIIHGGYHA